MISLIWGMTFVFCFLVILAAINKVYQANKANKEQELFRLREKARRKMDEERARSVHQTRPHFPIRPTFPSPQLERRSSKRPDRYVPAVDNMEDLTVDLTDTITLNNILALRAASLQSTSYVTQTQDTDVEYDHKKHTEHNAIASSFDVEAPRHSSNDHPASSHDHSSSSWGSSDSSSSSSDSGGGSDGGGGGGDF